ncbi:unnamed protein product [Cryptosporidium hominis]|uniref:Sister chromatid cohesion protein Dcc1 n=1 Tax=Cryptosporidium hominis TaxID=237895 RepID=A0A0S4TKN3_CRYHO|nr:hypothetical protein [Cryptosporidium hominis TU502]OLQ17394.1 hypothetical protein ChTU502y2012_405g0385 [Cryptosporidium hominis]PPA64465.1 Uncharacterized conserved protein (DUF2036) family protein [Cryptosporidium hominis]PPS98231.1 Sister chromatid cohesion protein Dcc1 [Cryptosporidium hominis]CUV07934.1 unnamed protein product [Cryptosporidium hominis]|eukprot:PPS98231.1 Sister chromatid cohesion protein Dcc1 [Cryptosporidium hominis]
MEVDFHTLYSKAASGWSLLQLDPNCEESLRNGKQLWLKGLKNNGENCNVPTVICTEDETFYLRREKSSNVTYLAIESENGELIEMQNDENSSNNESYNVNKLSVVGSLNSIVVMIKIPAIMNLFEDYTASHRNLTNNSHSEMTFKKLFSTSQISLMELYNFLFDYSSMMYCDIEGNWYSINNEILLFLLSSLLQKGMSMNKSFRYMNIKDVKYLLRESFSELGSLGESSENSINYNVLKHALSFDLTLIQLIKHIIVVPADNNLGNLVFDEFVEENIKNLLSSPRIQDHASLRNIDGMRVNFSYKRIQGILATSILKKHQVLKARDYIEEFQNILSNYIPLELSELEFEYNDTNAISDLDGEKNIKVETDFYYGFPLIENHPDNTGIRFDIIAGQAYYNHEDDAIIYLPSSSLPIDPRNRLSILFRKKKHWHISELNAYISPVLQPSIKLEAFCLKNCYVCEQNIFNKNYRLFYNKNLPLMH